MTEEQIPSWVTGDLDDVKEQRMTLPATNDLLVKIKDAEVNCINREGEERTWKWISLQLEVVDGIDVNGETKFKGHSMRGDMICYYADFDFYKKRDAATGKDYTSKLKTGQHMIDLKKLCNAADIKGIKIESVNGISNEVAQSIVDEIKGKKILINVTERMEDGVKINKIANYKKVATEDLV